MSSEVNFIKNLIDTLNSDENFISLQYYCQGFLDENIPDQCVEFAAYLSELLAKEGPVLEKQKPKMYEEYQKMWYQLVLRGFSALGPEDQSNILEHKLLFMIQRGMEPEEILSQYLKSKYFFEDDQIVLKTLAKYFEQNTETLGTNPITVQGRRFLPAIKYWLMDYASFPSKNAKRGSIDRLNYVNQSINTRPLTQVQKQQLLKILKLYDELLSPEMPVERKKERTEVRAPSASAAQAAKPPVNIDQKLQELRSRKQ